jgi:hypothetical protein
VLDRLRAAASAACRRRLETDDARRGGGRPAGVPRLRVTKEYRKYV